MRKAIAPALALSVLVCHVLFQILVPSSLRLLPVSYALPDMAPIDGDAWTENNNATYTWIARAPHLDATAFTTEKSYVGSYSLKVNHTVTTSSINFRLDLKSEQNFSSYDAISCWLYLQGQRPTHDFRLSISDSHNNVFAFILKEGGFDNATWIRIVIPLNAFYISAGSPSWSTVRYIEFLDAYRAPSDYTTYYIDGLRFTDLETPLVSESESDLMLPNFFYAISEFGDKQVTYNGIKYNSVYAFVNVSTGVPGSYAVEALESQSLGQTLFALAIAYNITKSNYLRTKIEAYATWINQLRSTTRYKGIRNYLASNSAGTIQNGWMLGGLSYIYNLTGDTIYKNIATDIRIMLVDEVWNSTDRFFGQSIDIQTGDVKRAGWTNDVQGSAVLGLSAYFRFVSADQAVKDRVEGCLNTQLTKKSSNAHEAFTTFNFEGDSYMHWGYFEAYKAFKNSTYWKYALAQAQTNLAYNMIYLNGSMGFRNNFVPMNQDVKYGYLDEWGSANSLLLLQMLYQETGDGNILQSFKKTMFDHIAQVKTPLWLVSRYRNAKSSYEAQFNTKSWQPTQAFIYASLVKYYHDEYKPMRPYPLLSTQEVKAVQWAPESAPLWNSFTDVMSDGGNATVLMYVPYDNETEKPFPNDYWQHYINEATQWGSLWDAPNRILTLWAVSTSTFRIVLERENVPPTIRSIERLPDNPEYSEDVTVKANITDDRSKVRGAILSYNGSSGWTNTTMTLDGAFYTGTIPPSPYGSTVAFKVLSFDNAANWAETEAFTYIVGDKTPPIIAFRQLKVEKLSTYDEVSIEVEVSEPYQASGVANATLWFKADDGSWQSKQLTRAGLWFMKAIVQLEKGVRIMQYYAEAYDNAGNKATSETYNYILASDQLILGLPAPVFAGIIIAAIGAIGVSAYILRARRSKAAKQKTVVSQKDLPTNTRTCATRSLVGFGLMFF
jgi:hypothetical protein